MRPNGSWSAGGSVKPQRAPSDSARVSRPAAAYKRYEELEQGEKRTSETPEIARFYETQAQLPSRGGPRAELDDRISKRGEESDEVSMRSATLLLPDNTTVADNTCVSWNIYNQGHYMLL